MSNKNKFTRQSLFKSIGSTVGGFGSAQAVRFVSYVILTRLLTPEIFGIMAIVNSVRTGIDLITDVGVGQNIVQNENAEDPDFYNTAWTLKIIRGFILSIICAAVSIPLAHFYSSSILAVILPVASIYFISEGFAFVSLFLLQKRLKVTAVNIVMFIFEIITDGILVGLAYFYRSIWAMVIGLVIASVARTIISFFVLKNVQIRFFISKRYAAQILHFGKWVFLTSIVYFLSMNFDRLYMGKVVPFALLGVYGVARSVSNMMVTLVAQLCNLIVFPYVSSLSSVPKEELHRRLGSVRPKLLLATAVGLASFAAIADFPVKVIYDSRYQAAAQMLPFLVLGVWFSTLCNINESVLLGYGKPQYITASSAFKFAWMLIGLPTAFALYGIFGIILVVALSDLFRYMPLFVGQIRLRFSFISQDLILTVVMFGLFAFFVWLRWWFGLGVAFSNFLSVF